LSIAWTIKSLAVFAVVAAFARRGRVSHPFPRWGPGNLTTLVRAAGVSIVAGFVGEPSTAGAPGVALAIAAAAIVTLLDWLDGWLARRTRMASEFGARFDMEVDALLILVLSILAWQYGKAGPWVIASGLMRYVFVAGGWLLPWMARPLPGSFRGKAVCVVQIASLMFALAPFVAPPVSSTIAAIGLIALTYSFAVDVEWLWNRRSADPESAGGRPQSAVSLVASLLLLNAMLTFGNVWPTPAVRWQPQLSVELAFVVIVLAWTRWKHAAAFVTLVWLALIVGRYAEVTAPALYGRDVNLYWDLRLMPDVASMVTRVASWWEIIAASVALLAAAVLAFGGLYAAWRRVILALADESPRRAVVAIATVVVVGFIVDLSVRGVRQAAPGEDEPVQIVAWPVSATYAHQARLVAAAMARNRPRPAMVDLRSDFSRIAGADVVLLFVESYGAVTFDRPEMAAGLAASRRTFESDILASGRRVASATVESPTFGGGSWLAHISLLSGIETRDPDDNALLMTEHRDTLVTAFHRGGFRTVAVMPGLRQSWPEGRFYGFDDIYSADRLAYRGPEFGWFAIPDQFSLERVDTLEIRRPEGVEGRRPLFVFFPTISTHFPFVPTPPYQPDWARMTDPHPYDAAAIVKAYQEPDWTNFGPGYIDAMAYVYATIGGFLRLEAARDLVIVVLGDHEPPAAVSGERASWNVPVHVIASHAAVLDRLVARGFRNGLTPARASIGKMHTLAPLLLDAFGERGDESHAH
jgi:phosphatidylglycerophosphate synthase